MNDNTITVSGNLIADPERRRTKSGHPMLTFRVASNHRYFNSRSGQWEEGGTNYYDVVAYRNLAVNAADSLEKGMGVHIQGHLRQRRYTRQDGTPGMSCEIEAKALGVDLTFVVAKVWRRPRGDGEPWADSRTGEIRPGRPEEEQRSNDGGPSIPDPETTDYTVARDHEAEEYHAGAAGDQDGVNLDASEAGSAEEVQETEESAA